jgi:hypothetical protein
MWRGFTKHDVLVWNAWTDGMDLGLCFVGLGSVLGRGDCS